MKDNKVDLFSERGKPIFSGRDFGGLYLYKSKTIVSSSTSLFGLAAGQSQKSQDFPQRLLEAHWCYGHLHFSKLRKLLGLGKGPDPDCAACTIAKSKIATLSKTKYDRSIRINHRLHLDIGFTSNSKYCFQLAIDDYSRIGFLDVFNNKSEAFDAFTSLHRQRNNHHCPYSLAVLRTDSEPLYCSDKFNTYCDNNGITREFSGRYRHDQHGVVERAMRTIGESFRCMMVLACAPQDAAPDGLVYAHVIRNNTQTKANKGWTPREKEVGMKLPINKRLLRGPLFCLVFAHVYEQERTEKNADRGIPCIYHGYDELNNQYKVKEWHSGQVYYTADVTFHPSRFPYRATPNTRTFDDLAPHVLTRLVLSPHTESFEGKSDEVEAKQQTMARRSTRTSQPSNQALRNIADEDVPPAGLLVKGDKQIASFNHFVHNFGSDPTNWDETLSSFNHFVHNFGPDPTTWEEALQSKYPNEWIAAREEEKNSFKHHKVLTPVLRSTVKGKKIFKGRPVYKIKINPPCAEDPNASINKFKYRLTIAAYTRMLTEGIDYQEKYASTVRWNSLKTIFAIACKQNYDIVLFDISSFFLYGVLHDEIYMEQEEGWEDPAFPKEQYVWKLNKSMYGLPQSPHRAQVALKEALYADGEFKSTTSDDCIYVGKNKRKNM
jgi:hypothetical protein